MSPLPRARCARCQRPSGHCLCAFCPPVSNRVPVCILQHPQESGQAKGSVDLLRLSLQDCQVLPLAEPPRGPGAHPLPPAVEQRVLNRPGVLLVYPHTPALPPAPPLAVDEPIGLLVLIDATWRKSLRLLMAYPQLQALPRLALQATGPARYAALRRAPKPRQQCATLEAACLALAQVTGEADAVAPLLAAFEQWVARESAARSTGGVGPRTGAD